MNVTFTNCLISYSTVSEVKDDVKKQKGKLGPDLSVCVYLHSNILLLLNSLVLNRGTDVHIMVL